MIAYLDSSVVLRVLLGQPDRLAEWENVQRPISSALAEVECLRTLDRLMLRGALSVERVADCRTSFFRMMAETETVMPDRAVLGRASESFSAPLGSLDAIHLATALIWRETQDRDLVMLTHDRQLGLAARANGLEVVGAG